ncbi:MAG: hypothetical protein A2W17_04475 [Planctomycetes bacterium RBG_16_41_13]|nr:MAG: hypothetical protein A2W17_04475 [Planctomycetes bacterium RBG_16_41_13]
MSGSNANLFNVVGLLCCSLEFVFKAQKIKATKQGKIIGSLYFPRAPYAGSFFFGSRALFGCMCASHIKKNTSAY